MMFTLIAVALSGYVMIESAPDFSNYAVLTRAQQFERNLGALRQAISSRRFYLTTSDGLNIGSANPADEALSGDELQTIIHQMIAPPGSTIQSSNLTLRTTPNDPFVPNREWGEVFWSASYNFIRNPAFFGPARRESRDPSALRVYYVHEKGGGGGSNGLVTTDRLARVHRSILSPSSNVPASRVFFRHLRISPDGTRFLTASNLLSPGINQPHNIVSFGLRGTNRSFTTSVLSTQTAELAEWSPSAGQIAFVKTLNFTTAPDKRMIIQSPEKSAPSFDPVGLTQLSGGVPFPLFGFMGPPHWSPDGSMVAFWVQETLGGSTYIVVYNWERRKWQIPQEDATGGVSQFTIDSPLCRTNGSPIAWAPDSDSFVYVNNAGADFLRLADNVRAGALGYTRNIQIANIAGPNNVQDLRWAPPSISSEGSSNNIFFFLRGVLGGTGTLLRRRVSTPPDALFTQVTDKIWINPQKASRSFDFSPGGTEIAYIDGATRTKFHIISVDGFGDQVLTDITTRFPGDTLGEVGFLSAPTDWVYPKAGIKKLTQANLTAFDHQGWRIFTSRESLFRGDSRFGFGYLQVAPPPNEEQFIFDNGVDLFRITEEEPDHIATDGAGNPELPTLGKMSATWGWRNVNYIARESGDITGGLPYDVFQQVVGTSISGTTVLITTGTNPAYGPDNQLLALSRLMSSATTFPPNTAQYPPVDMDLWVLEANGGPNPTPVNLTKGTTATAEGRPSWSPDGKYIYFQRETQTVSRFMGNHTSGIYRTTSNGGSITQIVGEASILPAWNNNHYVSALEFYEPAVSPDGTRLAFIARERLLGMGSLWPTLQSTRVGEIIGEAVYVKDLALNSPPVCLLRSIDGEIGKTIVAHPTAGTVNTYFPKALNGANTLGDFHNHTGPKAYADHGFSRPSWSSDGLRLFVGRTYPRNRWFPQKGLHRHGPAGDNPSKMKTYHQILERSQIVILKVTHPPNQTGITKLPDNSFDPPADNFQVLVQNLPDDASYKVNPLRALPAGGPGPVFSWGGVADKHILNAEVSHGAYAFQRITQDVPATERSGITTGTDYVLSGYARTKGGIGGLHAAQIMCQLINNQGLAIDLTTPGADVFQVGLADIGGEQWTRFSAGIRFDPGIKSGTDNWGDGPPYTLLLSLYSLGGVGATAEFTGLKLEKAFDSRSLAPTAFSPGWVLHSSSLLPDPNRPKSYMFER
jgi:Tol biopolymer transport system component